MLMSLNHTVRNFRLVIHFTSEHFCFLFQLCLSCMCLLPACPASLWIINRKTVWLGCWGYMRKPKGVKPLDPRVPPIHHQYSPITSLHNQGELKKQQTSRLLTLSISPPLLNYWNLQRKTNIPASDAPIQLFHSSYQLCHLNSESWWYRAIIWYSALFFQNLCTGVILACNISINMLLIKVIIWTTVNLSTSDIDNNQFRGNDCNFSRVLAKSECVQWLNCRMYRNHEQQLYCHTCIHWF